MDAHQETVPQRSALREWSELALRLQQSQFMVERTVGPDDALWKPDAPDADRAKKLLTSSEVLSLEAYLRRGHVAGHDVAGKAVHPDNAVYRWIIQPGGVGVVTTPDGNKHYIKWLREEPVPVGASIIFEKTLPSGERLEVRHGLSPTTVPTTSTTSPEDIAEFRIFPSGGTEGRLIWIRRQPNLPGWSADAQFHVLDVAVVEGKMLVASREHYTAGIVVVEMSDENAGAGKVVGSASLARESDARGIRVESARIVEAPSLDNTKVELAVLRGGVLGTEAKAIAELLGRRAKN